MFRSMCCTRWRMPICVALICLASSPLQAVTFYVATNGNDAWSGRQEKPNAANSDGPLATLVGARDAIRKLKAQGPLTEPVHVVIAAGVYPLQETFVFEPQDSGTAAAPITYQAAEGAKPVFSGGRRIAGFQKGEAALWVADVPDAVAGKWQFRQLFVNGRRACRAKTPNEGYLRVAGLVDPKTDPANPVFWWNAVDEFRFNPGDLRSWDDPNDVEVVLFHSWNTSRLRIASVDEKESIVHFTGVPQFRVLWWDKHDRYYVENVRDALDSPGEWYLDRRQGKLYYGPLPSEDMSKAEVVAPLLDELVRFDGKPDDGAFVDHINLKGLAFQHADWSLPAAGYGQGDAQGAFTVPAVVSANGARHCAMEGCELAHVGTYGIWLCRGCKENRIVQNHIYDLGAGGIRVGEAYAAKTDVAESSDNRIENNYIHDGCYVYHGAVAVWISQSSGNTIAHNEIHSFDYSGISVGWDWGFIANRTKRTCIEYNHIHHLARGVLNDVGAIYTLGPQPGAVIRNNLLHDIFCYTGGIPVVAVGIYFDAGSSEILVENNIVYNTTSGGIGNTWGPNNVFRNNIFALSGLDAAWRGERAEPTPSTVERNVFYLTQGDLFHDDGGQKDVTSRWDYNLYWRTDGRPLVFYGETFAQWQAKGLDPHGQVADPGFVDPSHGDFTLKPDSPASKLGFQPIDTNQIGLQGPTEWVNLPKQVTFPASVLPQGVSRWQPAASDSGPNPQQ